MCMRTNPLYLIYLKDYRDVEQEKPGIVPQAWCEEPLTRPYALPAPLGAGGESQPLVLSNLDFRGSLGNGATGGRAGEG